MNNKQIGVVGLGLMGTAIAQRLIEFGYTVYVYNRTRQKADPLLAQGARWSDNPLAQCDRGIISLYTSDVVDEVLAAMEASLRPGQILIDTTTGQPEQMAALGARLAARGVHYLDAPISGSSEVTRQGQATLIAGGPREAFDACRDLFDCLVARSFHVGACGNGARMKLVSNLVLGLNRAALAEGLAFARAIGLRGEDALRVLIDSPAYSRQMDAKGAKMVQGDFRVQAKLSQHLKDVGLMLDLAAAAGLQLPLSQRHRELLEAAQAAGFGELDNSAIIRVYDAQRSIATDNV